MRRPVLAVALASGLAVASVATPTQTHARWGGSWVLGALSVPAFPYGYAGHGCCGYGYPAYYSHSYGYPGYAYAYAPNYHRHGWYGGYRPFYRRARHRGGY